MKPVNVMIVVVGFLAGIASLHGSEIRVQSRIDSVGLFKNGLAVVSRVVEVPGPGTYLVDDVPAPVHGTFWVESTAQVVTRVTSRNVEVDLAATASMAFQDSLAGRKVVIHFKQGDIPIVSGIVEQPFKEASSIVDYPATRPDGYNYYPYGYNTYGASTLSTSPGSRMLIIRNSEGLAFVDPSMVAYLRVLGEDPKATVPRPVLIFEVGETSGKPAKLLVSYLAKGLSWSPSYRVDLKDPERLKIAQKAVIRNELARLDGAQVYLISGFPSVQFGHVTSPLAADSTWSSFFKSLNRRPGTMSDISSNVISQQAVMYNEPPSSSSWDLSAAPADEGVDIHYEFIGPVTLDRGDAMALEVASASAAYEHIVEWTVPDNRSVNGRYISDYERRNNPEKYRDSAWDAVRFKNPFSFPMTTAPALVVAGSKFNGQRTSYWANAGEEMTLHINKALSLRTLCTEKEEKDEREIVYIAGEDYRQVKVSGIIRVRNHRKDEMKLIIRRRFSGDLIKADEDPEYTLLEEGVYSVNRRNELVWTLALQPGVEKQLGYEYTVLVQR